MYPQMKASRRRMKTFIRSDDTRRSSGGSTLLTWNGARGETFIRRDSVILPEIWGA